MYHPAQDVNHCVYRLLLILECSEHQQFNVSVYRLIDFYVLFPYLIKLIKILPRPISNFRGKFADIPKPFESLRNTPRILHELERLQSITIQNLIAKELLEKEAFENGSIKRTDKPLPESFYEQVPLARLNGKDWFKVLINEFPKAKFTGSDGLKARSGLMEYRYDLERV